MKFQDSSFSGLKVTIGTKSVTHRTHARSKSNMPHQLFQSWGHNEQATTMGGQQMPKKYKASVDWNLFRY